MVWKCGINECMVCDNLVTLDIGHDSAIRGGESYLRHALGGW